ncbi:multicopper oxidase domain-containing protein [Oscillochloris sp. ZM17-4]|uniref:multicopper oxidase domain-containing protein n=1 Tax=Oscillochloris sp. ZM17-4 TaxID=2866714 RepID=UPI001C72C931|nr:multicopper oxidase domain-containing protein [Oscillochloris sp. ZM17-4]MBX0329234.1 multicopper oxidase domain-containing protein [Oscillochloris sp. ZM17-4]
MRLFARYLTAALLAVAMLALSLGTGVRQAEAAPAARLTAITLGAPSATLTAGTPGSVTYLVSVTKNTQNNNSTANLSIIWSGGTPAGVTASFSPASLTNWNGASTRTSTLTINTSAATPAAARNFTVRAQRSGSGTDIQNVGGTLTVGAAVQQTGTITFGAAPAPTYLGGNFTVSTTTNSNGALTYSAVSGPCSLVSGATFSTSGAGDCTVQADTAATTAFTAATAQQVVSIAPASQTISLAPLANKALGSADFAVAATASSGLAVTFTADPPTVCTISGDMITLVDVGTCTVTAEQAGDVNYSAATAATAAFDVVAALADGCALSGNARTCNLWAQIGAISLPGTANPIPVWSYTDSASGTPGAVGPTLYANAGEDLTINLTNNLGEATSIQIPGLGGAADASGAAASGGTKVYTFASLPAGTYIYQAGILTGSGPRQIAMGLAGALVVREAGSTAYGHGYDDEAVLVYSEIDPNFNASPDTFVLEHFSPVYLLINGKVYPSTDAIPTQEGHTVLLRQVNAGIRFHSIGVLGLRQTVIADDAGTLPISSSLFAKTLGAGQTMDSLVTVPANVNDGTVYALYDSAMPAHGSAGVNGMGGMLTFITAGGTGSTGGTGGGGTGGTTDTTAPTLNSIVRTNEATPITNAASVQFDVTFSEIVTGVDIADFSPTGVLSGAAVTAVSGSGLKYTVTVSTGIGSGALGLSKAVGITISDQAGNALGGASVPSEAYTIDKTAPTTGAVLSASSVSVGTAVGLTVTPTDANGIASVSYRVNGGAQVSMTLVNGTAQSGISTTGMVSGDSATVLVTVTDAAGNSSTQSLSFSVGDSAFANNFETGATNSTWGWTSKSTTTSSRLQVNATAAMAGTARGLQAAFGTGSSANNYVEQSLPATETQLHVRFYLNPHSQNFGTGAKTIFKALGDVSGVQTEAFRLDLRRTGTNTYQVRASVARANGTSSTTWQSITNGSNYIEMAWANGASTQFQLYVNGVAATPLNSLLTSAYTVNTLRLGPQTSGTSNTNIYLDEFKTTRNTMIGAGAN